jgi:hypothetical protein
MAGRLRSGRARGDSAALAPETFPHTAHATTVTLPDASPVPRTGPPLTILAGTTQVAGM